MLPELFCYSQFSKHQEHWPQVVAKYQVTNTPIRTLFIYATCILIHQIQKRLKRVYLCLMYMSQKNESCALSESSRCSQSFSPKLSGAIARSCVKLKAHTEPTLHLLRLCGGFPQATQTLTVVVVYGVPNVHATKNSDPFVI